MVKPSTEMIIGMSIGIPLTLVIIALVLSFLIIKHIKSKKNNSIGFRFEAKVRNKLLTIAKDKNYKYLNGGLFKYGQSQMFELDGILISNKAVFIIEVKYFVGQLSGDASAVELELKTKGNKILKFKNPLIQNFKHIQHFYKMCGFNFPVFSLVILPTGSSFNINNLESWALVTTEDQVANLLDDVAKDMSEDRDLTKDELLLINESVNSNRNASLKDIKRFGKILSSKNESKKK
ncbi:NERD domain-containing protein [Mycoplasmopsis caviae]|uniref:NERD domain-containing protein n=1 Tax=Mycoplasmopsis caviae TaxID=55603 RepID=A0A3P8KCK1_9BACT|nr:nuclease-related domain-containing protein [Mycoplasmopsis caviae]UUD34897.1 NERD domain-containing protein [Mycoplasmopsis caviae]VDR42264.1 Nuclease-related domain [Mycoplasmopsis caviae]